MDRRGRIGGRSVLVSDHALERYHERVKPTLLREEAEEDLMRFLPGLEFTFEKPVWASAREAPHTEWVLFGDGIAFVVHSNVVITCITRGEVGAEIRMTRRQEDRAQRKRKGARGHREKHGKVARDARRRARDSREAME